MKAAVEGAESLVCQGAVGTLARWRPVLINRRPPQRALRTPE
jgi:hypothetical protein